MKKQNTLKVILTTQLLKDGGSWKQLETHTTQMDPTKMMSTNGCILHSVIICKIIWVLDAKPTLKKKEDLLTELSNIQMILSLSHSKI